MYSAFPQTTPPSTRPCPSMYLVAECSTKSAPKSRGVCKMGVAKQLSTAKIISFPFFKAANSAISIKSKPGLEGLSQKKNLVFSLIATSQALIS